MLMARWMSLPCRCFSLRYWLPPRLLCSCISYWYLYTSPDFYDYCYRYGSGGSYCVDWSFCWPSGYLIWCCLDYPFWLGGSGIGCLPRGSTVLGCYQYRYLLLPRPSRYLPFYKLTEQVVLEPLLSSPLNGRWPITSFQIPKSETASCSVLCILSSSIACLGSLVSCLQPLVLGCSQRGSSQAQGCRYCRVGVGRGSLKGQWIGYLPDGRVERKADTCPQICLNWLVQLAASLISYQFYGQHGINNNQSMLFGRARALFSLKKMIHDLTYTQDTASVAYRLLSQSPSVRPEGIPSREFKEQQGKIEITKLANGITVLTEGTREPGAVNMAITLDLGTRDETNQTSGALLSIKNTYLKTVLNTNETVNYGMVQMSGGRFLMDYDRQFTTFKASCLPHDVVDIFGMMSDCALEPRSVVAAQVALKKNQHSHKLDEITGANHVFTDNLFKCAFGNEGLGRSLLGSRGNVSNLSSYTMQKFQLQNIHPSKVTVVGVGIDSHKEFVDLVTEKLGYILANPNTSARVPALYQGGELRAMTESGILTMALGWQSAHYGSQEAIALQMAAEILGSAHERTGLLSALVEGNSLLDSADAFNFTFRDAGLFGIKVSGSAANSEQILAGLEKIVKDGFKEEDLNRAKGRLIRKILTKLDKPFERVEILGREQLLGGIDCRHKIQMQGIQVIGLEQVHRVFRESLSTKLSINARGGMANKLPSYDALSARFTI